MPTFLSLPVELPDPCCAFHPAPVDDEPEEADREDELSLPFEENPKNDRECCSDVVRLGTAEERDAAGTCRMHRCIVLVSGADIGARSSLQEMKGAIDGFSMK